jgi:hypothetical protein
VEKVPRCGLQPRIMPEQHRAMVFIEGENLVGRFQAMKAAGRVPTKPAALLLCVRCRLA